MIIWDLPPEQLCHYHLVSQHGNIHLVWNVVVRNKVHIVRLYGPEADRWVGKLGALYDLHTLLVHRFAEQKLRHYSPLDIDVAIEDSTVQNVQCMSLEEQKRQRHLYYPKCTCQEDE